MLNSRNSCSTHFFRAPSLHVDPFIPENNLIRETQHIIHCTYILLGHVNAIKHMAESLNFLDGQTWLPYLGGW